MPEQEVLSETVAFIQGCSYPCSKQKLIDTAETNGAPQEVIDTLDQLPEADYLSETVVIEAIEGCLC